MSKLGTRKHYYRITLTKPDGSQRWNGKAATEADARIRVEAAAIAAGETPSELVENVESLVGPAPRTFTGNDDLPEEP